MDSRFMFLRRRACKALAREMDPDTARLLAKALKNPDDITRAIAKDALRDSDDIYIADKLAEISLRHPAKNSP